MPPYRMSCPVERDKPRQVVAQFFVRFSDRTQLATIPADGGASNTKWPAWADTLTPDGGTTVCGPARYLGLCQQSSDNRQSTG